MDREERDRVVDSVLDRALGPRSVEPRTGLEERILASMAAAPATRPWWRWLWVPAVAAAVVLAIVIGMRLTHNEMPTPVQVKNAVEQPKQEVAVKPEAPAVKKIQPPGMVAKGNSHIHTAVRTKNEIARATPPQDLPRQSVFPAPQPLTEQERLLLALVRHQRPQAELIASEQEADRERIQKYFDTGEVPETKPIPAQRMR